VCGSSVLARQNAHAVASAICTYQSQAHKGQGLGLNPKPAGVKTLPMSINGQLDLSLLSDFLLILFSAPEVPIPESLEDILTFEFLVQSNPMEDMYAGMKWRFSPCGSTRELPSLKTLRAQIRALSGFATQEYHCCIKSCVLFTGYLSAYTVCPYCNSERYDKLGKPRNIFTYIPFIPQLLYSIDNNLSLAAHFTVASSVQDVGYSIIQFLVIMLISHFHTEVWGAKEDAKLFCFFEGEHDIVLRLLVDGMCPFKHRKQACRPLLPINYNLAMEVIKHLNMAPALVSFKLHCCLRATPVAMVREDAYFIRVYLTTLWEWGLICQPVVFTSICGHGPQWSGEEVAYPWEW
jgi:hypothetical protein